MLSQLETLYLTIDAAAILAVAIHIWWTEITMEKPTPQDFAESVVGNDKYKERETRLHAMMDDAVANEYDITGWTADDIVADLLAFADLELDEGEEEIKPHVLTWKMKRSAHDQSKP
jgi:hypothetical protein